MYESSGVIGLPHPAVVVIDPGHGGVDPGAVSRQPVNGQQLHESKVVLAVGKRVRDLLGGRPELKVVLTRDSDETVSLFHRVMRAGNHTPDLFVSIHCNSAANTDAHGIETWVRTDELALGSYNLARCVQASLVTQFPTHRDRGIKRSDFYVLRKSLWPSCLVELEFISNAEQAVFLATHQHQLAQAVADGIITYVGQHLHHQPE